ncbi:hypothetical protein CJ030_MR5G017535 [Morella rubra]|uniref:Uncharacterized protein n=1 Tax=Morella rubra TaxID=262757 RepID=A0A6A1VPG3_9ROSI|nr:hypothetical protein CJ030_MR5G017535 [Morella rubra]
MGFKGKNPRTSSTMRKYLFLVPLVLMILLLTQPSLADSRALGAEVKQSKTPNRPGAVVDGREFEGKASSSSTANSVDGRVVVRDQVFTLSSGPSRKGSGH